MSGCPLDYSLCRQTVTVYRKQGDEIRRQVVDGCYYGWQEQEITDEWGCRRETTFLLIMPGSTQQVFVGDRVYDGIGPEAVQWQSFLPVNVAGLGEVAYVKPCRWDGEICHVEAGRK